MNARCFHLLVVLACSLWPGAHAQRMYDSSGSALGRIDGERIYSRLARVLVASMASGCTTAVDGYSAASTVIGSTVPRATSWAGLKPNGSTMPRAVCSVASTVIESTMPVGAASAGPTAFGACRWSCTSTSSCERMGRPERSGAMRAWQRAQRRAPPSSVTQRQASGPAQSTSPTTRQRIWPSGAISSVVG